METAVFNELGIINSDRYFLENNDTVVVNSRQAFNSYSDQKYFKTNKEALTSAEEYIKVNRKQALAVEEFIKKNDYKNRDQYDILEGKLREILFNLTTYKVLVKYTTPSQTKVMKRFLFISETDVDKYKKSPYLLMGKSEYSKYLKELNKQMLIEKQRDFYDRVNNLIDLANECKSHLVISNAQNRLDLLVSQVFEHVVSNVKKIKKVDSEEWELMERYLSPINDEIQSIFSLNKEILDYYQSEEFIKIKTTFATMMELQREFNEYIQDKADSIATLFGTRVLREETLNNDRYDYIRPYSKSITPFTAEVSAQVFASAENNPLNYVVKYFYSNKKEYPDQIRNLYKLIEELATLRDAKIILNDYKEKYKEYLMDVPEYVLINDESGFYTRLGFANIDEHVLTVEYKFSYTSAGGMSQRSFAIPMTEETIIELIKTLENKLSAQAFIREQRLLMTRKLRESIKERDHYTCCSCGNSLDVEPNLLLEIDHIVPVSKGGETIESNLQTLCWKCNRAKSNKLV